MTSASWRHSIYFIVYIVKLSQLRIEMEGEVVRIRKETIMCNFKVTLSICLKRQKTLENIQPLLLTSTPRIFPDTSSTCSTNDNDSTAILRGTEAITWNVQSSLVRIITSKHALCLLSLKLKMKDILISLVRCTHAQHFSKGSATGA
jgi:hypothetical protein